MKSRLLIIVVLFASITLLQGCYTILDLPEYTPSEYTSNDTPQTDVPGDPYPYPDPNPGPAPLPGPIIVPIVTISAPSSGETPRNGDTQSIRNDGNGRGSSGRNTDFNNNTGRTSTLTESSSSSSTSSSTTNNSTRSTGTGNSGNGRR